MIAVTLKSKMRGDDKILTGTVAGKPVTVVMHDNNEDTCTVSIGTMMYPQLIKLGDVEFFIQTKLGL